MIDLSRVHNVAVRLPNWIGDAVMAIPAVRALYAAVLHARLAVIGPPPVARLYSADPAIAECIELVLDVDSGKTHALRRFAEKLRSKDFDLGVIFPDSFSSAYLFKAADIKFRIGYKAELRSILLSHSFANPRDSMHRSQKYLRLVSHISGTEANSEDREISIPKHVADRAAKYTGKIGRFAVVCPTTRAPSRRWGKARYVELLRRLHSELDLALVLAGSGDEADMVDDVGGRSGIPYLNLARESDILFSAAVMRLADIFIGNDSGAAHLAAASGTRVISISGADDPNETRPLARVGRVIRKELPCSPCIRNICPRRDHVNECMDLISVEEVIQATKELLDE